MRFLAGFLVGLLVVILGAAAIVFTGSYNVAASNPPSKLETQFATLALNKAVARRAPTTKNPFSPSADVLRAGFSHYKEMCVDCHGAPGVDASEFGEGLNPPAPDLTVPRTQSRPDGELFWIVSNGIKMTGMPSFAATHKSDEIWKIVAFVRHLPALTQEEQKTLKAGREEEESHHEEASATAIGKPAEEMKPGHTHSPGTKPHKD